MTDPTSDNGEIETDFEVGQDNIDGSLGPIGFDIHNPVFVISGITSVVFVLLTMIFPDQAGAVFLAVRDFATTKLCRKIRQWSIIGHIDRTACVTCCNSSL